MYLSSSWHFNFGCAHTEYGRNSYYLGLPVEINCSFLVYYLNFPLTYCFFASPIDIFLVVSVCAPDKSWLADPATPLDVDAFVDTETNPPNYVKVVFMHSSATGGRQPVEGSIDLSSFESPHVEGLRVTQRLEARDGSDKPHISVDDGAVPLDMTGGAGAASTRSTPRTRRNLRSQKPPLVIGTIRMGFGHHRIAYAAASWARAATEDKEAGDTYFHDLLNIDSEEADLIKSADAFYSKMSRITSNFGGPIEKLWGKAMLKGDGDALRITGLMAVQLRPLLKGMPTDTPIIATHSLVALAAVACGFTNVINLVIDNHAQFFVVVPQCLNLVQGPVNYQSFLRMGVEPENLELAGHWIPRDLVENIPDDCERRVERALSGFDGQGGERKPRRILIPVGGAGAQRAFIVKLVKALAPLVEQGDLQLFLNAGDHKHMEKAFVKVLKETGLTDYDVVTTTEGVKEFRDNLLNPDAEPAKAITLFTFDDYFPAVATTDILSRVSDVLACKPSELAFYPVPKLMIRRVGDHEQFSALRAAELGDGTLEARTIDVAMNNIQLFIERPELLVQMNESIVTNNEAGIYDGCKNAVQIALERAAEDA